MQVRVVGCRQSQKVTSTQSIRHIIISKLQLRYHITPLVGIFIYQAPHNIALGVIYNFSFANLFADDKYYYTASMYLVSFIRFFKSSLEIYYLDQRLLSYVIHESEQSLEKTIGQCSMHQKSLACNKVHNFRKSINNHEHRIHCSLSSKKSLYEINRQIFPKSLKMREGHANSYSTYDLQPFGTCNNV